MMLTYISAPFAKRFITTFIICIVFGLYQSATGQCLTTNIAAGKPVTANLFETYAPGSNITDGDINTEWFSGQSGTRWAYVDLGQAYNLCKTIVKWPYGSSLSDFKIQASNDATNWTDIAVVPNGDWGLGGPANAYGYHDIDVSQTTTAYRYVRLYIPFVGGWGGKVRELEVYNKPSMALPVVDLTAPATGSSFAQGGTINLTATASVQGGTISKVEFYQGTTKLGEDVSSPYQYPWTNVMAGDYTLVAKAFDSYNNVSVSDPITIHVLPPTLAWALGGNSGTNSSNNFLGTTDAQPLIFKTSGSEAFRITPSGQLAIGVTNPHSYKLAVGGTMIAEKIKVKLQSTWPDYVFDKSYVLMPLPSLEDFIKRHHHLPGVPSQKEMQATGIDIEDTQAFLLKKIEELTLYIIEQNKELERQKKEQATLQRKLKRVENRLGTIKSVKH
jgi:uncharacterized coiled-coil protein SlyX